MMRDLILHIDSLSIQVGGKYILRNVSFDVTRSQQWAIVGRSGSGKTLLLETIAGHHLHQGRICFHGKESNKEGMVLVEQQHHFKNRSNLSSFYYQQRFNSEDAADSLTVEEDLRQFVVNHPESAAHHEVMEWLDVFGLKKVMKENLIQLSNGENKRLQLVKALSYKPSLLLLDNPFLGLDNQARTVLENVLAKVTSSGINIVMIVSHGSIPSFITNVLSLESNTMYKTYFSGEYQAISKREIQSPNDFDETEYKRFTQEKEPPAFEFAVVMTDVHIKYGDRVILEKIDWKIRRGERWSLSGPNGAGKSTLLSLINGDNPQAFANDIHLFGRKKGSGESIWEIKSKIGFISPELHLHFDNSENCFDVVACGLFDTIGLFRHLSDEDRGKVNHWMHWLKIDHLSGKLLLNVSNSEQRMVLLARALVKNPPLLILDEPCQGLDQQQVVAFKRLINLVTLLGNKTLIYVSHYTDEIPECVDKFLRLENGRIVSKTEA